MLTLAETKQLMEANPQYWAVYLMDFVDDFRYYRHDAALSQPFALTNSKFDALLASTAEYLCAEMKLTAPMWLMEIPAVADPWFVSGLESLKAITLVETPVWFRKRKIFVLANFLSRV
jgi:hypothetical protein